MEEVNASPAPVAVVEPPAQPVQGQAVPEWWIRTRDKVGVCGFSPSSKDLAPFQDDTWELWGCNELYRHVPRLSAIFEIHNWEEYPQSFLAHTNPGHMEWLKNSPIPIVMWKKHPDIPKSVSYPWTEIFETFPRKYLNNSISLMIAMAILLDFKEIGIWGVDMAHKTEYGTQRPSVEYYLGICDGLFKARGYPKLFVAPQCDLLKAPYIYGQEDGAMIQKILRDSRDHYAKQTGIYSQQLQQSMMLQQQYLGGQAALDAILQNHLNY